MEPKNNAIEVFCCYAHEDEDLLDKLKGHLSSLQRQKLIDIWYDREIRAGTEWNQEIKEHLNEARIILLLVSPDFIKSDYCYQAEMKHAIARYERNEAIVIPVILRPVTWQDTPIGNITLGRLQALPKNIKPVTTWKNRDEAWKDVAEGIERAAKQLLGKQSILSSPPQKK